MKEQQNVAIQNEHQPKLSHKFFSDKRKTKKQNFNQAMQAWATFVRPIHRTTQWTGVEELQNSIQMRNEVPT